MMPEKGAATGADTEGAQPRKSRIRKLVAPGLLKGLWTFLNSAFFLFLLSTVAITWATKLYTDYQAREELRSERRLQAIRLVSEVSLRSIRLSSLEFRREQLLKTVDANSSPEAIDRIRNSRAELMQEAKAIIRGGGGQGNAASEFSGTHLSIMLRQNDLLTGYDSEILPLMAAWVESENIPLKLITSDLVRYVNLQDVGLRDGMLPLLPGDDEKSEEFQKLVKKRGDAIPAQIRAMLNQNYKASKEFRGDPELEAVIADYELADTLEKAFGGDK
jgi:hypothetical protein